MDVSRETPDVTTKPNTCVYKYVYIYIYNVYRERERDRDRHISNRERACITTIYIYIYIYNTHTYYVAGAIDTLNGQLASALGKDLGLKPMAGSLGLHPVSVRRFPSFRTQPAPGKS